MRETIPKINNVIVIYIKYCSGIYCFISLGSKFQEDVMISGDALIQLSNIVPNVVKRNDHMRQKLRHWGIGESLIIVLEGIRFIAGLQTCSKFELGRDQEYSLWVHSSGQAS